MSMFDGINIFNNDEVNTQKAIRKANEVLETIRSIPKQLDTALQDLKNTIQVSEDKVKKAKEEHQAHLDKHTEVENIIKGIDKLFTGN